ncbi:35582_t:CDS:1, partial [Gigaspora margarita]
MFSSRSVFNSYTESNLRINSATRNSTESNLGINSGALNLTIGDKL